MSGTLVIIPTYNERENLTAIAVRVLAQAAVDLLIVDDGSPDGTGLIADELAVADSRVHVLHRPSKGGLGGAYRAGFAWGIEAGFDILVELDGDGSHQPEELDRLRERMPGADMVIGSRWVAGGSVVNWPWRRRALSRAGSRYARAVLGLPFRDVTGGYRAFSAEALARVGCADVASQGYCFQVEMLLRAWQHGLRIEEVPITFIEREHGYSKMSGRIVIEAMMRVTLWGMSGLPGRLAGIRSASPLHAMRRRVNHAQ
ncbi:dolichol-phosphate mannosyltransferase [Cryobacterium mesophilum]|uniref:Polyprenol monophosphomannose synthase n=1 Tax=Terrimesophilobacter mesophilus TaxID=433647 RepID=A0A4R8V7U0_9MICO|nr:polyprenol monophosphomannose synthase [Terrimesophilobacter mesophilus]MBB5631971.1 dolichol-phosphate mannosyltransferase [Terrimesophilobacter mesophilus]TFB78869.1 polyprenol monophosphomannose synthase [Terrimesophilobacter mesophilus]